MTSRSRRNLVQGAIEQWSRAEWTPLLEAVGDLSRYFTWMGEIALEDGTSVHAYKHRDTRRYLHLGTDGRDFDYVSRGTVRDPKPGCYRAITRLEGLEEAFFGWHDFNIGHDNEKELSAALEKARDHARRGVSMPFDPEFLARQRRFEAACSAARLHERYEDPGFSEVRIGDDGNQFFGDLEEVIDELDAA